MGKGIRRICAEFDVPTTDRYFWKGYRVCEPSSILHSICVDLNKAVRFFVNGTEDAIAYIHGIHG